MLLISLGLIYFAVKHYNISKDLMANGIKTKAKVIELIEVSGDDGYTYKPVFEYTDREHNTVKFKSDISSSPSPYNVGDIVEIVYSKDNYEKKIISFWGLYRWPIISLSIACPLLIIGGGYILYSQG